jgi:hypothetical protein
MVQVEAAGEESFYRKQIRGYQGLRGGKMDSIA